MKLAYITPLSAPITSEITIPGSKSYTNRALLMAAMTDGPVSIENPLLSDDTKAMVTCLKNLGIEIEEKENAIIVKGSVKDVKPGDYILNTNLSGTTIRFLLPLCCVLPGTIILKGEEGLNKRPIGSLVDALRQLGASIECTNEEGFPPLKISSSELTGKHVRMKGGISSQYFSALLMIAPIIDGITVEVEGEQISKPYIDMTIDSMKAFGVNVVNNDYTSYTAQSGQTYSSHSYVVEGDFSSAGYFFALAALTKSTMTLHNLNPQSAQADRKLLEVLEKMGSSITSNERSITITGNGIKTMDIDMLEFPDQAQTVAVLLAFANGKSALSGVQSLRVKETERVVAVQNELAQMGIKTEATHETLTIHGGNPKPARIATYGDHRMAMSFAVAGTKLPGMVIENPEVVNKTFPDFWKKLNEVGVHTKEEVL